MNILSNFSYFITKPMLQSFINLENNEIQKKKNVD